MNLRHGSIGQLRLNDLDMVLPASASISRTGRNGSPIDAADLGVFGPNKDLPFHRWVSFTEGFSAQLVAAELASVEPGSVVLDPFGGTGTTPLVAAQLGHRGLWAEVNPYLREAAAVKVEAASAGASTRRKLACDLREATLQGPDTDIDDGHPLLTADRLRDFFPDDYVEELLGWTRRFDALGQGLASRLGRMAVASCVVAVSNMKRAVDLRRRTPAELRAARPSVTESVRGRVAVFLEDLETGPLAPGSAACVSSNATCLPDSLGPVDLVVTSPPYLNGTNYCRNTKLELLLLGLISSEADLAAIRKEAVTAGINNVSRRISEPLVLASVEPLAERLEQVGYDTRLARMVRAYFSDMKSVFEAVRRVIKPGGRLALDIGDSQFAGVYIDTPSILAQLAEDAGWRLQHSVDLRPRTSKDGTALCQKLLYLSSP